MEILKACAKHLNDGLVHLMMLEQSDNPDNLTVLYTVGKNVINAKVCIFNASTALLIVTLVSTIFGSIRPISALVLGGGFFFLRATAEESFNVIMPKQVTKAISKVVSEVVSDIVGEKAGKVVAKFGGWAKEFLEKDILKPTELLSLNKDIVVFYTFIRG